MRSNATTAIALLLIRIALVCANKYYGSLWAIPNHAVVAAAALRQSDVAVRQAFGTHLINDCGVVQQVLHELTSSGAIQRSLDISFDVVAGGFDGRTYITLGYTVMDSDDENQGTTKNRTGMSADVMVLTNSLGYVFSQGSVFLLDGNNTSSFDFPANYVVMVFTNKDSSPTFQTFSGFFDLVGTINPDMFRTYSSGYTQYGNTYLSLQSNIDEQQFIDGYVKAGIQANVTYTPVANGVPSLFSGGAAYPRNNWRVKPGGEEYLARIPPQAHNELSRIRELVMNVTLQVEQILQLDELRNQSMAEVFSDTLFCGKSTDDQTKEKESATTEQEELNQNMSKQMQGDGQACTSSCRFLAGIFVVVGGILAALYVQRRYCHREGWYQRGSKYEIPTLQLDENEIEVI